MERQPAPTWLVFSAVPLDSAGWAQASVAALRATSLRPEPLVSRGLTLGHLGTEVLLHDVHSVDSPLLLSTCERGGHFTRAGERERQGIHSGQGRSITTGSSRPSSHPALEGLPAGHFWDYCPYQYRVRLPLPCLLWSTAPGPSPRCGGRPPMWWPSPELRPFAVRREP